MEALLIGSIFLGALGWFVAWYYIGRKSHYRILSEEYAERCQERKDDIDQLEMTARECERVYQNFREVARCPPGMGFERWLVTLVRSHDQVMAVALADLEKTSPDETMEPTATGERSELPQMEDLYGINITDGIPSDIYVAIGRGRYEGAGGDYELAKDVAANFTAKIERLARHVTLLEANLGSPAMVELLRQEVAVEPKHTKETP